MNNKSISIFVPARLNSERLPNKQILPLGDTCMFDICCRKLQRITSEFQIPAYVLICDKELIEIAEKYSLVNIIIRDEETSNVDGPLQFIFKDIASIPSTHLMFLNPCPIMLSIETIVKSINDFLLSDKDYGTSVKGFKNWTFDINGNPLTQIDYTRLTTKEVNGIYQCAHCFHIFNKDQFLQDGYMLKQGHMVIEVPIAETIDIDDKEDYEYAKYKWEKICN